MLQWHLPMRTPTSATPPSPPPLSSLVAIQLEHVAPLLINNQPPRHVRPVEVEVVQFSWVSEALQAPVGEGWVGASRDVQRRYPASAVGFDVPGTSSPPNRSTTTPTRTCTRTLTSLSTACSCASASNVSGRYCGAAAAAAADKLSHHRSIRMPFQMAYRQFTMLIVWSISNPIALTFCMLRLQHMPWRGG